MKRCVELLAPAGSYECFLSAIINGADAVYIGGNLFGARAFAQNFTTEEILEAIDFAHLHDRKLFLTVNTLLKDDEIKNELYQYLLPLYEHGLDAVIVQDIGVIRYIRSCFPDLPVHVSTQMTVTDSASIRYLESLGVTRIVTARELSLSEIRSITSDTKLEIESFVHGALCYCYSGQCLFSSLIGGRSGNRGQCAQPCRLPYQVDGKNTQHVLSLKDICTLKLIPDMIEAGIHSFKIEGRMKSPVYVGSVVAMYRKYIDLYLEQGREGFSVDEADIEHLMDVYNRGAFTEGYYKQRCGKGMVSLNRPNHAGIPVIRVRSDRCGVAVKELHKGDTIEIPEKNISFSMNQDVAAGDKVSLSPKHRISPKETKYLFRTFNKEIADHYDGVLKNNKIKEKINGDLILSVGRCAKLCIDFGDLHIEVEGDIVQRAERSPLKEEQIRKQMMKTGQTAFVWKELHIHVEGEIFLPLQSLNELRRKALDSLQSSILDAYRRCAENLDKGSAKSPDSRDALLKYGRESAHGKSEKADDVSYGLVCTALVMKREQLDAVMSSDVISDVYVDCNMPEAQGTAGEIHSAGKRAYYVLPHIIRKETDDRIRQSLSGIEEAGFDGIMVRNIEGYQILRESGYIGEILADHSVYTFNRIARENWQSEGISRMTVPLELNQKEISLRGCAGDEIIVYGYLPMMVSAQCVQKTVYGCAKKNQAHVLTDRRKEQFSVQNYCDYCYNVIYNSKPLYLLDKLDTIRSLGAGAVRLQFSTESGADTEWVLEHFQKILKENTAGEFRGDFTRGHFSRGVK